MSVKYSGRILKAGHPELRQLRARHTPTYQGHKLWNATWLLLSFLEKQGLESKSRVVEAGCGWGLASIFCARTFDATVTAFDVDEEVFPFLELHARVNGVHIHPIAADFENVADEVLREADALIGADICFRESIVDPLLKLLERALNQGRLAFRSLSSACQRNFNGAELEWQTQEPMLPWAGERSGHQRPPAAHWRLGVGVGAVEWTGGVSSQGRNTMRP